MAGTDASGGREPVGSGVMERTVVSVINWRMTRRAMRWCRATATALVARRAAILNANWDRRGTHSLAA